MNVTLSPQFETMIHEWVEGGDFADAADVVEEALRRMDVEERVKLERLRAALQVGLDQIERGEYREYTPEVYGEILANARRKIREGHRSDPDVCP